MTLYIDTRHVPKAQGYARGLVDPKLVTLNSADLARIEAALTDTVAEWTVLHAEHGDEVVNPEAIKSFERTLSKVRELNGHDD